MANPTIERKIFFFRVQFFDYNDNEVDASPIFTFINNLPFGFPGRYYVKPDGNFLSMILHSTAYPIKIQFGVKRVNDLPLVENNGNLGPLGLPQNSGLYESFHAILFDNKIMGAEFNFHGPRVPALDLYIRDKVNSVRKIKILPIIKGEINEILENLSEIRAFTIEIPRDSVEYARELDDNLGTAFEALKRTSDSEYLEVKISKKYVKNGNLDLPLKNKIIDFMLNRKEYMTKLRLRGKRYESINIEDFDLLDYYILSKKKILQNPASVLNVQSVDMFRAIQEAYNELSAEISHYIRDI